MVLRFLYFVTNSFLLFTVHFRQAIKSMREARPTVVNIATQTSNKSPFLSLARKTSAQTVSEAKQTHSLLMVDKEIQSSSFPSTNKMSQTNEIFTVSKETQAFCETTADTYSQTGSHEVWMSQTNEIFTVSKETQAFCETTPDAYSQTGSREVWMSQASSEDRKMHSPPPSVQVNEDTSARLAGPTVSRSQADLHMAVDVGHTPPVAVEHHAGGSREKAASSVLHACSTTPELTDGSVAYCVDLSHGVVSCGPWAAADGNEMHLTFSASDAPIAVTETVTGKISQKGLNKDDEVNFRASRKSQHVNAVMPMQTQGTLTLEAWKEVEMCIGSVSGESFRTDDCGNVKCITVDGTGCFAVSNAMAISLVNFEPLAPVPAAVCDSVALYTCAEIQMSGQRACCQQNGITNIQEKSSSDIPDTDGSIPGLMNLFKETHCDASLRCVRCEPHVSIGGCEDATVSECFSLDNGKINHSHVAANHCFSRIHDVSDLHVAPSSNDKRRSNVELLSDESACNSDDLMSNSVSQYLDVSGCLLQPNVAVSAERRTEVISEREIIIDFSEDISVEATDLLSAFSQSDSGSMNVVHGPLAHIYGADWKRRLFLWHTLAHTVHSRSDEVALVRSGHMTPCTFEYSEWVSGGCDGPSLITCSDVDCANKASCTDSTVTDSAELSNIDCKDGFDCPTDKDGIGDLPSKSEKTFDFDSEGLHTPEDTFKTFCVRNVLELKADSIRISHGAIFSGPENRGSIYSVCGLSPGDRTVGFVDNTAKVPTACEHIDSTPISINAGPLTYSQPSSSSVNRSWSGISSSDVRTVKKRMKSMSWQKLFDKYDQTCKICDSNPVEEMPISRIAQPTCSSEEPSLFMPREDDVSNVLSVDQAISIDNGKTNRHSGSSGGNSNSVSIHCVEKDSFSILPGCVMLPKELQSSSVSNSAPSISKERSCGARQVCQRNMFGMLSNCCTESAAVLDQANLNDELKKHNRLRCDVTSQTRLMSPPLFVAGSPCSAILSKAVGAHLYGTVALSISPIDQSMLWSPDKTHMGLMELRRPMATNTYDDLLSSTLIGGSGSSACEDLLSNRILSNDCVRAQNARFGSEVQYEGTKQTPVSLVSVTHDTTQSVFRPSTDEVRAWTPINSGIEGLLPVKCFPLNNVKDIEFRDNNAYVDSSDSNAVVSTVPTTPQQSNKSPASLSHVSECVNMHPFASFAHAKLSTNLACCGEKAWVNGTPIACRQSTVGCGEKGGACATELIPSENSPDVFALNVVSARSPLLTSSKMLAASEEGVPGSVLCFDGESCMAPASLKRKCPDFIDLSDDSIEEGEICSLSESIDSGSTVEVSATEHSQLSDIDFCTTVVASHCDTSSRFPEKVIPSCTVPDRSGFALRAGYEQNDEEVEKEDCCSTKSIASERIPKSISKPHSKVEEHFPHCQCKSHAANLSSSNECAGADIRMVNCFDHVMCTQEPLVKAVSISNVSNLQYFAPPKFSNCDAIVKQHSKLSHMSHNKASFATNSSTHFTMCAQRRYINSDMTSLTAISSLTDFNVLSSNGDTKSLSSSGAIATIYKPGYELGFQSQPSQISANLPTGAPALTACSVRFAFHSSSGESIACANKEKKVDFSDFVFADKVSVSSQSVLATTLPCRTEVPECLSIFSGDKDYDLCSYAFSSSASASKRSVVEAHKLCTSSITAEKLIDSAMSCQGGSICCTRLHRNGESTVKLGHLRETDGGRCNVFHGTVAVAGSAAKRKNVVDTDIAECTVVSKSVSDSHVNEDNELFLQSPVNDPSTEAACDYDDSIWIDNFLDSKHASLSDIKNVIGVQYFSDDKEMNNLCNNHGDLGTSTSRHNYIDIEDRQIDSGRVAELSTSSNVEASAKCVSNSVIRHPRFEHNHAQVSESIGNIASNGRHKSNYRNIRVVDYCTRRSPSSIHCRHDRATLRNPRDGSGISADMCNHRYSDHSHLKDDRRPAERYRQRSDHRMSDGRFHKDDERHHGARSRSPIRRRQSPERLSLSRRRHYRHGSRSGRRSCDDDRSCFSERDRYGSSRTTKQTLRY